MKKFIYLSILILLPSLLCSCEEKKWKEDELSQTEVLTITISSTDTEAYYLYPEYDFFIYEYNVNLNRYDMSDWSYVQEEAITTITFRRDISDDEYATYELLYSSSTNSGRLTIEYFVDEVEDVEQQSILTVSLLATSTEYIDLN
ncbi:MAG: hypothetical protein SNG27_05900 [Rikenellaceae bacterium]